MENVTYDLFSRFIGGINAKGKPYLLTFAVLAKNWTTGMWAVSIGPGASDEWMERHNADENFILSPNNDSVFCHDPPTKGDVVVRRGVDLKLEWPECWWFKLFDSNPELQKHLS